MMAGGYDRPQRLPGAAPCNVCIYKVSDKAGYCWSDFECEPTYALYQIQVSHEARPSVLMQFRDSFGDYLKEMSKTNDDFPCNLDMLRNEGCIKLVVTNNVDPENVGFVQSMA